MTVLDPVVALDLAGVCSYVLDKTNAALVDCGRPVTTKFVAAGLVAWDDCCGMLVVAPERVFRTARFPVEGPDENGCFDGLVAVNLVVLLMRCVPVLDDRGRPPTEDAMSEAYADLLHDAAIVWNELGDHAWPEGWESASQNQVFVGAEGGCIGAETRVTLGLDQEAFCPECATVIP
jgi:hypothetical protein